MIKFLDWYSYINWLTPQHNPDLILPPFFPSILILLFIYERRRRTATSATNPPPRSKMVEGMGT